MTAPQPEPSPGAKALAYVNNTLGANKVYEDAVATQSALSDTLDKLTKARHDLRTLDSQIEDQEMVLIQSERGKHSDMSEAAMTRHLKVAFNKDPILRDLRNKASVARSAIDALEADKSYNESDLRVAAARMTELGGMLQFMATIKTIEFQSRLGDGPW